MQYHEETKSLLPDQEKLSEENDESSLQDERGENIEQVDQAESQEG